MVSSSRTIRDTREWLAKTCESPALGNDHFFDNRGYVIMCYYCGKVLRVTHIHLQYILVVVSYLCLLAALGGQFVDDDMLQSPLLSTMQRYDVSGLLISSVAIPVPLLLDLAGDVYHLMSRNLETFTDDADATLYRMVTVCKKEFVLRLAFLVALGVPSAVLVFKDPFVSEASHSLVPYMTSFCRCITLYCATTGYMSDLFDVTWTAKTLSLLSSVAFTLGLLLVFYARVDRSEGYFAWDDVGGLAGIVLAVSATIIFVARVVRYAAVVAWREATSLQSTIRMEEYVFVCYGTGAVFVVTTILLCDFSRVDGRLLYDFLHAPAVVVYYVLMIVGTLAAVLLCTRALRSWSFDVRYASLTARVLQLDGMLTSKLLAVATANAAPKQPPAAFDEAEEEEEEEEAAAGVVERDVERADAPPSSPPPAPLPLPLHTRTALRAALRQTLAANTGAPFALQASPPGALLQALDRDAFREAFGSSVSSASARDPVEKAEKAVKADR